LPSNESPSPGRIEVGGVDQSAGNAGVRPAGSRAAPLASHPMHIPRVLTALLVSGVITDCEARTILRRYAVGLAASQKTFSQFERDLILERVEQCRGNVRQAAESLGVGRTTLYRKLRSYGAMW
jgi:transcriptional regulator with GAF, ATPase, and Fis domain